MYYRPIALPLFLVLLGCTVVGQDDWHTYPFRDLATVIEGEQAIYEKSGKADMVISAKPFPSKTRVVFTGQRRAVSVIGKSFMLFWTESRNVPASNVDLLLEEFLFLERGKEIWMPVQKGTAQAIATKLKVGDEIIIYYFYLGGFNAGSLHSKHDVLKKLENRELDGIRWLFAVERVERPGSGFPLMLIDEIVAKYRRDDLAEMWVSTQQIRGKIKLVFAGEFRDVTGKRKEVKQSWFEKQGAPGASQLMQSEGLFKVDDKEYWIILRNQTRDHLSSYVKKGDTVFLNTMFAGALKKSSGVEWVFMSGEYSTF